MSVTEALRHPAHDGSAHLLATLLGRREPMDASRLSAAEWAIAAEAASWHGLLPTLHLAARATAPPTLPPTVRRLLADAYTLALLRAEARRQQLDELLDALGAAGVRVIVLKGAYLAEHAYPAPTLRPMTDLDLMTGQPLPGGARSALAALGYAPAADAPAPPDRHAPPLLRPGRLPVELHHTIEPCSAPFTLDLDAVWARTRPCAVAGHPVLALATEDLLLHVSTHMGHSHVLGASLVSVCDVHAWTERFGAAADWDAVVVRARASGVRRYVHAALALAHQALGARVPREVLRALRTPADDAAVVRARGLLSAPPFLMLGAKSVTDPQDSTLARVARVARALLVSPAIGSLGPRLPDGTHGTPSGASRDGYRARWAAVARLVLQPSARRAAARQVADVRELRRWAAAADG